MRPRALPLVLLLVAACRAPTQITLELSTNVDCSQHKVSTQISIGHVTDVDQKPPSAETTSCQPGGGRIGDLVVVPSGADDDTVAIDVVAGVDVDPSVDCRPPGGPLGGTSCIVARRALAFIPHENQTLPVVLSNKCLGVTCPSGTTCVDGVCKDEGCSGPACPVSGLGDAGADASIPEAAATDAAGEMAVPESGRDVQPDVAACVGPQCSPVTLATLSGGAVGSLAFIAVAGTTVYYTVSQSQPLVGMCALSGAMCVPSTLWRPSPGSQPNRLAVDGLNVYWADYTAGVYSCPLGGCNPNDTTYASTAMASALGTDGTTLFWSSDSTMQLHSCSIANCAPGSFTTWTGTAGAIATDGTNVYWTDSSGGAVLSSPTAGGTGGTPTTLASSGAPFGIAIDTSYVYWTDYVNPGGAVWRVGKDRSSPMTLATAQAGPHEVAVDATGLYWANRGTQGGGDGQIMWCPAPDCSGGPTAIANAEGGPWGIALDPMFVYWTNRDTGELRRAGKR